MGMVCDSMVKSHRSKYVLAPTRHNMGVWVKVYGMAGNWFVTDHICYSNAREKYYQLLHNDGKTAEFLVDILIGKTPYSYNRKLLRHYKQAAAIADKVDRTYGDVSDIASAVWLNAYRKESY